MQSRTRNKCGVLKCRFILWKYKCTRKRKSHIWRNSFIILAVQINVRAEGPIKNGQSRKVATTGIQDVEKHNTICVRYKNTLKAPVVFLQYDHILVYICNL